MKVSLLCEFTVALALATVLVFSTAEAVTLFEDDFSGGLDAWELTEGGGTIEIGASHRNMARKC